ncbi:hypothetical protein AMATHDRAFT_2857 [Amanita thiersii Skay4041]|uniref:Uncharacterized protein n=1 Tax=Amanita thiersii Skay4041 TaxID=703135 RepID=A0A2A9NV87_9AGAR|nr:hypothetical protein AMATHDRAFT_2857 [Amanita thiersii Skay4041]
MPPVICWNFEEMLNATTGAKEEMANVQYSLPKTKYRTLKMSSNGEVTTA